MRKWLVAASILIVGTSACNTQIAATENNLSPDKPALTLQDVLPVKKPATARARATLETKLKKDAKRFKSRQMAAAYYVTQAKRTFNAEKPDSATYFFGKAWQMDSTNNDVYWGYGLLFGQQEKHNKALFILYHALEKDSNNPHLLKAIATSHLGRFYIENDADDLLQSRKLLEKALKLKPDDSDTYYKLAVNNYYLREYSKAWKYLHKSISQDKEMADKAFIAALLEKEEDPLRIYQQ